jgi:uncharacterized protein (TIGR02466 family)
MTDADALARASRLMERGQFAAADALLRRIVAVRADHPATLHLAGMAAFRAGRRDEGVALMERALGLRPNMPDALYNLGVMQVELARTTRAIACFARLVALRPDHVEALNYLGNLHRSDGAYDAAVTAYRQALAVAPPARRPVILIGLAQALAAADRAAEAKHAALAAVQSSPDAIAYAALGAVLLRTGEIDDAVEAFGRAAALAPADVQHETNLAMALHRAGRDEDALAACDRALARDPRDGRALHHKSALLSLLGRAGERDALLALDRLILEHRVEPPDPGGFNRELVDRVLAHPSLVADPPTKSTRGGRQTTNLFAEESGPFTPLVREIRRAVARYRIHLASQADHPFGGAQPTRFSLMGWATVLDEGGHQLAHFHPAAWICGVYYPQVPETIRADDAERAGWIGFGRPQDFFEGPDAPPERWFHPREGTMLLFPGFLGHRTRAFRATRPRISIAFDALIH